MRESLPLTGPIDLDALDRFLMSDASPENCMQLSDLDGFLAGIAIGPDLILPSEWLPLVWGGEEPVFENAEQAQSVIGTIMGRYNEILRTLNTDPEGYVPLFWEGPDGEAIAADWAEGFADAIRLRPEAWQPLLEDQKALIMLMPVLALCSDAEGGSPLELDPEEDAELLAQAPELIPACVAGIHDDWRSVAASAGRALDSSRGQRWVATIPVLVAPVASTNVAAASTEQLPRPLPDAYPLSNPSGASPSSPPVRALISRRCDRFAFRSLAQDLAGHRRDVRSSSAAAQTARKRR